jgi:KDO2-lipid IV(A) lauroyltransferase
MDPGELDAVMSWQGIGHLEAALVAGNGAIISLPHLGGWDLGGAWLCTVGYPITVVVEPLEPPELFEWFAGFRRSLGMTVVPLGPDAGRQTLKTLRGNGIVCLLSDRDVGGGGVEVEFFGERTKLPAGPATLSLRTGAPILPTAIYYDDAQGGHNGIVRPPLVLSRSGSLRDDVVAGTQALARELEGLIRLAPEQWHLMQPNWPSDWEIWEKASSDAVYDR